MREANPGLEHRLTVGDKRYHVPRAVQSGGRQIMAQGPFMCVAELHTFIAL